MVDYNFDEMDIESVVQLVNDAAKEHSDAGLPDDFQYNMEYDEKRLELDSRIGIEIKDRFAELEDSTNLSGNEAHVVALKELGLTHRGIKYKIDLCSEGTSKSSVDEYSRRARKKFLQAQKTVELLAPVYGDNGRDDK